MGEELDGENLRASATKDQDLDFTLSCQVSRSPTGLLSRVIPAARGHSEPLTSKPCSTVSFALAGRLCLPTSTCPVKAQKDRFVEASNAGKLELDTRTTRSVCDGPHKGWEAHVFELGTVEFSGS